jgi:Rrf2 family iron-sulfur cluster assembly transcriptional regulator
VGYILDYFTQALDNTVIPRSFFRFLLFNRCQRVVDSAKPLETTAMRLTTKGRYAVTAMLDLALHSTAGPVSLAEIAGRQELSLSYLEQLFVKLRRKELVVSSRGPGGGYSLNQPTAEICVADIIDAVDERVDATSCSGKSDCQEGNTCLTHHLWNDLTQQIHGFLTGISLADLVNRKEIKRVSQRQDSQLNAANDLQQIRIASSD